MTTHDLLAQAMSYQQYKTLLEDLLAAGKTTGANQSEDYLGYAKINLQRMHRLEKTILLHEEFKSALTRLKQQYTWLVITEGWCGDAAQNLPVLYHVEKACDNIRLRFILRDEHPEIMNNYLTNGSKAIPKIICLKPDASAPSGYMEKFVWGPRPAVLQKIVMKLKEENVSKADTGLITQNWYNADKTLSTQNEFLNLVCNL